MMRMQGIGQSHSTITLCQSVSDTETESNFTTHNYGAHYIDILMAVGLTLNEYLTLFQVPQEGLLYQLYPVLQIQVLVLVRNHYKFSCCLCALNFMLLKGIDNNMTCEFVFCPCC